MEDKLKKFKWDTVAVRVSVAVFWDEEEETWYAFSPTMNNIRDGDTAEEAVTMFRDATEIRTEYQVSKKALRKWLQELYEK